MTLISFTSDPLQATPGEHRDDTGRLTGTNTEATRSITDATYTTPAYPTQDARPTMQEIYSRHNMRRIRTEVMQAPEIDLTGYQYDADDLGKLVTLEASNV